MIMTAKTVNIGAILEENLAKQLQQRRRQFGLRIQRVQVRAGQLPRALAVAVQPFSVKILALPAVIDRGQNFIGPVGPADLKEDAPAVASRLIAIQFQKPVFAGGNPAKGSRSFTVRVSRAASSGKREKNGAMCARGFIEIHSQNRRRNNSSDSCRPSLDSTTDLAFFFGSEIRPFLCRRSRASQL